MNRELLKYEYLVAEMQFENILEFISRLFYPICSLNTIILKSTFVPAYLQKSFSFCQCKITIM